jgi:hypothetical protein
MIAINLYPLRNKTEYEKLGSSKICSCCGLEKKNTEFDLRKIKNNICFKAYCRDCSNKKSITYRKKDTKNFLEEGILKRKCSICSLNLTLDNFSKNKTYADGLSNVCKKCMGEYNHERYLLLKDTNQYKEYAEKVSTKYKNRSYLDKWAATAISHHNAAGYKILFKQKQLRELVKATKNCQFCGNPLNGIGHGIMVDNSPSLDNLYCKKELKISDIAIICMECNRTKSKRTLQEFFDYCEFIYKNKDKILNTIHKNKEFEEIN